MKRFIFFVILFQLCFWGIYAYGGSENEQSQALLYRQKRTAWPGAPESAVFYECYLVFRGDEVFLVDAYLRTGFLKTPMLLINTESSMKIAVHNKATFLKKEKTIYKCVVLESGGVMGMAVVNVFSAEPVTIKIGYVFRQITFYSELEYRDHKNYWEYYVEEGVYQYEFDENKKKWLALIGGIKCVEINQWPNPTEFRETDFFAVLEQDYNNYIKDQPNLTSKRKDQLKQVYERRRNAIQDAIQDFVQQESIPSDLPFPW